MEAPARNIAWASVALIVTATTAVAVAYACSRRKTPTALLPRTTNDKANNTKDTPGTTCVKATSTTGVRKGLRVKFKDTDNTRRADKAVNTEHDVVTIKLDFTQDESTRRIMFEVLKTLNVRLGDL